MAVETRHPFSDRRVIEFFLSLPLEMKTYGPLPKRVIRAGMRRNSPGNGPLPDLLCPSRRRPSMSSLLNLHPEILEPATFKETLGPVRRYVNLNSAESARERA